jgi:hypothetical protein
MTQSSNSAPDLPLPPSNIFARVVCYGVIPGLFAFGGGYLVNSGNKSREAREVIYIQKHAEWLARVNPNGLVQRQLLSTAKLIETQGYAATWLASSAQLSPQTAFEVAKCRADQERESTSAKDKATAACVRQSISRYEPYAREETPSIIKFFISPYTYAGMGGLMGLILGSTIRNLQGALRREKTKADKQPPATGLVL